MSENQDPLEIIYGIDLMVVTWLMICRLILRVGITLYPQCLWSAVRCIGKMVRIGCGPWERQSL